MPVGRQPSVASFDETNSQYHNYGGRGIIIHESWVEDHNEFVEYCLTEGWEEGLEIDRKDNNGNYEPGNLRFVTREVNSQNIQKSKRWHINGNVYPSIRAAAKAEGIPLATIQQRVASDDYPDYYSESKY